jgi:hypothetical protein
MPGNGHWSDSHWTGSRHDNVAQAEVCDEGDRLGGWLVSSEEWRWAIEAGHRMAGLRHRDPSSRAEWVERRRVNDFSEQMSPKAISPGRLRTCAYGARTLA